MDEYISLNPIPWHAQTSPANLLRTPSARKDQGKCENPPQKPHGGETVSSLQCEPTERQQSRVDQPYECTAAENPPSSCCRRLTLDPSSAPQHHHQHRFLRPRDLENWRCSQAPWEKYLEPERPKPANPDATAAPGKKRSRVRLNASS